MIVGINILFWMAAALTFFGMIGETRDKEIQKGCTYGFMLCITGLIIINALYFM